MNPSNDTFTLGEPLILISIRETYSGPSTDVYEAVRKWWKINPNRAKQYDLVLARYHDTVVGAYRPERWEKGGTERWQGERWGFVGYPAEQSVQNRYVGKRVPDKYRRPGAANPVRYCRPED